MCQLLCGRNKNQFFHYFGLLRDLLQRQDLPNKWFERRLKHLAMVLSSFGKGISPGWFYYSNFQGNFEMTLELCGNDNFSFLHMSWVFSWDECTCFLTNLSAAFSENLKPYWSQTRTSTSHSRKFAWKEFYRNFINYSRRSFEFAVINRL